LLDFVEAAGYKLNITHLIRLGRINAVNGYEIMIPLQTKLLDVMLGFYYELGASVYATSILLFIQLQQIVLIKINTEETKPFFVTPTQSIQSTQEQRQGFIMFCCLGCTSTRPSHLYGRSVPESFSIHRLFQWGPTWIGCQYIGSLVKEEGGGGGAAG
jgi:hypothetical protein